MRVLGLTLLPSLILLLVLSEQHVVRKTSARNRTLGTHRVTLASQASSALLSVRKKDTTLLLDIDRAFGLCLLGLRFVLLLFLLGLLVVLIVVGFALLSYTLSAVTLSEDE